MTTITEATDAIILPESEHAAQRVTLTGWVDRRGHFWGADERRARLHGATHLPCDRCGTPMPQPAWSRCDACREQDAIAAYQARVRGTRRPRQGDGR